MEFEIMTSPKVRLPKSCKWAVEDTISLAQKGYELARSIHQQYNDPNLLHQLLDLMEIFILIDHTSKQIGIQDEQS